MVDTRTFSTSFSKRLERIFAARAGALARNPRLIPPAVNNAGTYTLADGSTVTVTASASAPTGTNLRQYPTPGSRVLADYEAIMAIEGGFRLVTYSSNVMALACRSTAGALWDGTTTSGSADLMIDVSTETNSPAIAFAYVPNGSNAYRPRFLINDQYIDLAGHAPSSTAGALTYYTLTFSKSKTRKITVELEARSAIQRVFIVDGAAGFYSINRPDVEQKPRLLVVADSYGVGPFIGTGIASDQTICFQGDGMYQQAADWLGVEGIVNAQGGTSFMAGTRTYASRWQDVLDINAQQSIDALHISGSINAAFGITGSTFTAAQEQAAATAYLVNAVAAFPNIPITLSGCPKGPDASATETAAIAVEAAYAAAVQAAKDQTGSKKLAFIPWQAPQYVRTWPVSGGSSLISTDNTHLKEGVGGGHESVGKRFATDWFRAVQKMAA